MTLKVLKNSLMTLGAIYLLSSCNLFVRNETKQPPKPPYLWEEEIIFTPKGGTIIVKLNGFEEFTATSTSKISYEYTTNGEVISALFTDDWFKAEFSIDETLHEILKINIQPNSTGSLKSYTIKTTHLNSKHNFIITQMGH